MKDDIGVASSDMQSNQRYKRLEKLRALTRSIERDTKSEPTWDERVSDKDILGKERMRHFR